MNPLLLTFVMLLLGPAEPTPVPLLRVSGAEVLLQVPAWSEVLAGGRVVVLEPEFLHLAGYHAGTGKLAWRRKFQDRANGQHSLHVVGDKIFAWTGNRIHAVDPRTGRVLSRFDAPWNGGDSRCALGVHGDVCSIRCECSFHLFDCRSGRQLGKSYGKTRVEFIDMDGSGSGGCYGPGGDVVGRSSGTVVVIVEDPEAKLETGAFRRPLAVVGLDAGTGEERWRRHVGFDPESWGLSPDGSALVLANRQGAVLVLAVRSGAPLPGREKPDWETGSCCRPAGSPGLLVQLDSGGGRILDAGTHALRVRIDGVFSTAETDGSEPDGSLLLHGFAAERGKIGEAVLLRIDGAVAT